jgi:hypothetical protein
MITINNYDQQKNSIDWKSMPKNILDNRNDVEGIMEFYNDDTDIKETVDLFFKGINANSKPVGEIIVVNSNKKENSSFPTNLSEFKKYLKDNIGKTLYLESNYRGELRKEIRIIEKVQSNSVAFKKAIDTKANNLSWLDYGKAGGWTFTKDAAKFGDEYVTLIYNYEKPTDWIAHSTPIVENKPAPKPKKETLQDAFLDAPLVRSLMPKLQQMAVLENDESEEVQFFIDKVKALEAIFVDAKKIDQNTPIMDKIVKAHYFYGSTDWYIFDYDPKDNVFFGYVVLNGDTQMSEAGYISVEELMSVKRVELDFFWDQVPLGKALHSQYPSEFDVYKPTNKINEVKTTPAKKTTPKKEKVKAVVNKKYVDNFTEEFKLIKRFWNVIDDVKITLEFRKAQLLYMAFNKAAIERKVRKESDAADIFTECNKKMKVIFEEFMLPNQEDVKVDFTDKKLYNEIKEYVQNVAVNPAVAVLKRFIAMQNTLPNVKQVETLLKSLRKVSENFKENRLLPEINKAINALEKFLEKPTNPIKVIDYSLSRPRVCTNRIKCAGVDKNGKLHKGYKFQEHTGYVVKTKSKSSTSRKPKVVIKKKNLGLKKSLTVKLPKKAIVPGLKNPITNIISSVVYDAFLSEPKVPKVNNKLMSIKFDTLPINDEWSKLMQNPASNMKIAIWGAPKNGKTAGALQMANYLTEFGKVLYNFADQGFNKSTQDLWISSGLSENPKAEPSDISNSKDLEKEIAKGKYKFVFIDMISDYIRTEKMRPEEFKERFIKQFPNVSFILIFEVTKGGNFKGDQGWTHLVDAIMTVEDFLIENRGRYGMGKRVIWEEGLKRFNPKKHEEYLNECSEELEEEISTNENHWLSNQFSFKVV